MICFFMDGNYAFSMGRSLAKNLDYKVLGDYLDEHYGDDFAKVRRYYYNVLVSDDENVMPLRKLTDFLSYNGYVVRYFVSPNEVKIAATRAFTSLNIAVDALTLLKEGKLEKAIFCVGDTEYVNLLSTLRNYGVETHLFYAKNFNEVNQLRQHVDVAMDVERMPWLVNPPSSRD